MKEELGASMELWELREEVIKASWLIVSFHEVLQCQDIGLLDRPDLFAERLAC